MAATAESRLKEMQGNPNGDPSKYLWIVDRFTREPVPEMLQTAAHSLESRFIGTNWTTDRIWIKTELDPEIPEDRKLQTEKEFAVEEVRENSPHRVIIWFRLATNTEPPTTGTLFRPSREIDIPRAIGRRKFEECTEKFSGVISLISPKLSPFSTSKEDVFAHFGSDLNRLFVVRSGSISQDPYKLGLGEHDHTAINCFDRKTLFARFDLENYLIYLKAKEIQAKESQQDLVKKYFGKQTEDEMMY